MRRRSALAAAGTAAVAVALAVYRTTDPDSSASRSREPPAPAMAVPTSQEPSPGVPPPPHPAQQPALSRAVPPARASTPTPSVPTATEPGRSAPARNSEDPRKGIAGIIGASPDVPPPGYRGSPSAWRMHQRITREECVRLLRAFKSLSAQDRDQVSLDVIRYPSPELRQPLLDAVAVSDAGRGEAIMLAGALVKLIEKAPLDAAPTGSDADRGPTDAKLAAAVVWVTSRMLDRLADVVGDNMWRPLTEDLRKLRTRGLIGPETPGIADLRRGSRTALAGLVAPDGTFAAGVGVFEFVCEWPDPETVDLLISVMAVFQKHRSRLPDRDMYRASKGHMHTNRACLDYVAKAVVAAGNAEQLARYATVLGSMDWAALDLETKHTLHEYFSRQSQREDIDVATRDNLTRIADLIPCK